jgi:hypothetical protein
MTFIELPDTKWTRQSQTVRGAAHLRGRRHDVDITHSQQSFFELDQAVRMNTIVVCDQNACHEE